MKSLLLSPLSDKTGCWCWQSTDGSDHGLSTLADLAEEYPEANEITLIVPAAEAILRKKSLNAGIRTKKQIREVTPWEFEDDLTEDIEDLHFAFGKPDNDRVEVVIVSRLLLENWIDELQQAGFKVAACYCEQQLLPCDDSVWHCTVDDRGMIIRTAGFGSYCDADYAQLLLKMLAGETAPERIEVLAAEKIDSARIKALFPDDLQQKLNMESRSHSHLWLGENEHTFDLLQGDFATRISWGAVWTIWSGAVAASIIASLIGFGSLHFEVRQLDNQNTALEDTGRQLFSRLWPDTPYPGASEAQQQALAVLATAAPDESNSSGSRLSLLLYRIGQATQALPDIDMISANYKLSSDQLEMEFSISEFKYIQQLRDALKNRKLQTRIVNSTKAKDRLKVKLICEFIKNTESINNS